MHYGSPDKDPALRLRVIDDAGRARVPVHHRHPRRHRRDAARPRRVARRPARRARAPRPRAGGHRAELPREAPDRDAGRSGRLGARVRRGGRRRAARDGPAHAHPGAAEPLGPGRVRPARARRRRRLGRGLAPHRRPRQPRAAVAAPRRPRRAHGRARLRRCASASPRTRSTSRDADEWIDPAIAAAATLGALADRADGAGAVGSVAAPVEAHAPGRRTAVRPSVGRTGSGADCADGDRSQRAASDPRASTTPTGSRCSRRPATTSTR